MDISKVDELTKIWLGNWFLFQTFEELDGVKDKKSEALQIRQLLNNGQEETAC